MNCHGNNQEKQGNHKHSPLKHMLHMVLCCGLPIVIIGLLPVISRFSPGVSRILGVIAPFICPIMMVGMMGMMFRGNKRKSCCDDTNQESNTKEIV
jgi:hypothetical protein